MLHSKLQSTACQWCVNDYDPKAEPEDKKSPDDCSVHYIPHAKFMEMLEPIWCTKPATSDANKMAVLKRSHIFLNSEEGFFYYRPASEDRVPVARFRWERKVDGKIIKVDYLRDKESKDLYQRHRKGKTNPPPNFEADLVWEKEWVSALVNGVGTAPPLPMHITGPTTASVFSLPAPAASSSTMPLRQWAADVPEAATSHHQAASSSNSTLTTHSQAVAPNGAFAIR